MRGTGNSHRREKGQIMAATERVVVLMSTAEKSALEAKAANAGSISTGEFIRRAVASHDEPVCGEAEELQQLLSLLAATHEETLAQLGLAEQRLDDTLTYLASVYPRRSTI
jgi:hypothetical protein